MFVSLKWIEEFTDIEKKKSEEIAERVSVSLTEVEKVENFRGIDVILEIENKALTHRPDCFGHLGIAREMAAIFSTKFKNPIPKLLQKKILVPKNKLPLKITVQDPKMCPRYTAIVLKNVKVKPSPLGIQERLLACGLKPINNVVDITNLIMLEFGQPLHSFDYDKLKSNGTAKEIIVRQAKLHERIITLDGIQRELKPEMLVIADSERPIAIAGVMGGMTTQITEETKNIIIESANFYAPSIRRTGKIVGLHTDATLRFEKGQDPELTYPALIKAIDMLKSQASAQIISPIYDLYGQKVKARTMTLNLNTLRQKIGIQELKNSDIKKILTHLDFTLSGEDDNLKITIPTFRSDITIEEDFIEEVTRIYGYDKITPSLPQRTLLPIPINQKRQHLVEIMNTLVSLNFNEIYSYTFIGENLYKKCHYPIENSLVIKNPLSPDLRYIRPNLLPSILEKVELNSHHYSSFGLFEVGKTIINANRKKLPEEQATIAGILYNKDQTDDFYNIKRVITTILTRLHFSDSSISYTKPQNQHYCLNKNKQAEIILTKEQDHKKTTTILGTIGEIDESIKNEFGLKGNLSYFELNLDALLPNVPPIASYQPLPKFPSIFEDLSVIVDQTVETKTLIDTIKETNSLVISVQIKDKPFVSEKFGANKKSITFTIEYQHPQKTLDSEEIKDLRCHIFQKLKQNYNAQLRQ